MLNCHGPGLAPSPVARRPVEPGNSDLCFEWPGSIEEAIGHLESSGIAIELARVPRQGNRGLGLSVYFRDPDGSLIELLSYQRA